MGYQQVQNKPTAAYILSLIGGILWLLAAIGLLIWSIWVYATIASWFDYYSGYYYDYTGLFGLSWTIMIGLSIWMLIAAILIIVFAKKLNDNPMEHSKWGALILVFSIIGGLNILALIGGILALAYRPIPATGQQYGYPPPQPSYQQPYTQQQPIKRICPQCGRVVEENLRFCPNCGKALT